MYRALLSTKLCCIFSVRTPQRTLTMSGKTSKTLVLTGFGGYDKLVVQDRPILSPGPGEVLINVRASGINFAELMCRAGLYSRLPTLPGVLGFEGAGVVTEVGENVDTVKVGTRVIATADFSKGPGLWQEFAVVPAHSCFEMPDKMTFEEGAAIPVNYMTAYHMLFEFGNLRRGQSVLIHMAAGGVGCAATQLCRTVPDVTVFGTASASKHDTIRKGGVDHPIDYRTQDYVKEIRAISPKGVDIVLDPLSGNDSVKGYNLLKPLGKIIHFGAANFVKGPSRSYWNIVKTYFGFKNYNPLAMMPANKAACGYHLGYLTDYPEIVRSAMSELLELYQQDKIKPQIDTVWQFEDIADAMARMHDRKNIGKVIITPRLEK